jgi:hypothetical protein
MQLEYKLGDLSADAIRQVENLSQPQLEHCWGSRVRVIWLTGWLVLDFCLAGAVRLPPNKTLPNLRLHLLLRSWLVILQNQARTSFLNFSAKGRVKGNPANLSAPIG